MRPERPPPTNDAGPTAVHCVCDVGLVGSWVKVRKLAVNWSATGSPRPEPGTELLRINFQLTRVPVRMAESLVISSVQVPSEPWPLNALSGSWGLYGPAPMPVPATV